MVWVLVAVAGVAVVVRVATRRVHVDAQAVQLTQDLGVAAQQARDEQGQQGQHDREEGDEDGHP